MKTFYVSASNGNIYRVKAHSATIAGVYVAKMYHIAIVAVE